MLTKSKSAWAFLMVATLSSTTMACAGSDELGEQENVSSVKLAMRDDNGLSPNGLTTNGLTTNGLTTNGLVMSVLTDPLAQKFLSYLVSCALPADQQITVTINSTLVTFNGGLGLAPSWGLAGGTCDSSCQAWISACVLSRVNYLGEHVPLSERGPRAGLGSDATERAAYPRREGAYWGDIFSSTQVRYVCTEQGSTLISRSCGPDPSNSIMNFRGNCTAVCDPADATDGSFSNCRDVDGNPQPTVTVFRQ
jgi:GLTT repeat (6 copies)